MPKTLTIRDEVYRKLLAVKAKDESFSMLFERLIEGSNPIETLRKIRGSVEFSNKATMLAELASRRGERRT